MDNKEKNAPMIKELYTQISTLQGVRKSLSEKFNNDMNKDVVKIVRHAEHVIEDYIETLK